MDRDERKLFASTLRAATTEHRGAALDAVLDELGWRDALCIDRRTAVSLLFELQGEAGTTSSGLEALLVDALGVELDEPPAVVLPATGAALPPGRFEGESLAVDGLGTTTLTTRGNALVVAGADDGAATVVVMATGDLDARPVTGIDPSAGLFGVRGADLRPSSTLPVKPDAWTDAVATARIALGHELVGASAAMLALAREHALERVQFGQAISSFQAVRHRLAEALVAIETARAAVDAAWDDGSPTGAKVAKAAAGRSARIVTRHAQQVLAGIGFTTEHPLHTYIRRARVLDRLFGDARTLTRELGAELLASRTLPAVLPI